MEFALKVYSSFLLWFITTILKYEGKQISLINLATWIFFASFILLTSFHLIHCSFIPCPIIDFQYMTGHTHGHSFSFPCLAFSSSIIDVAERLFQIIFTKTWSFSNEILASQFCSTLFGFLVCNKSSLLVCLMALGYRKYFFGFLICITL